MNIAKRGAAWLSLHQARIKANFEDLEQLTLIEQAVEAGFLGISVCIMNPGPKIDIWLRPEHDIVTKSTIRQRYDYIGRVDGVEKIYGNAEVLGIGCELS